MKLNLYGKYLLEKWNAIYYKELADLKERNNDPHFQEGTIIVDHLPKTLEDEVGWCLLTYDTYAIYTVEDWIETFGGDSIYGDYTNDDVMKKLLECYEREDNMEQQINKKFWNEINGFLDKEMANEEERIKVLLNAMGEYTVDGAFDDGFDDMAMVQSLCESLIKANERRSKLFGMLCELQADVSPI